VDARRRVSQQIPRAQKYGADRGQAALSSGAEEYGEFISEHWIRWNYSTLQRLRDAFPVLHPDLPREDALGHG